MQEFKNFDPQRLELLEARIMGNRHTPIVISDEEHHSNDSEGSASRNSHQGVEEKPEVKVRGCFYDNKPFNQSKGSK